MIIMRELATLILSGDGWRVWRRVCVCHPANVQPRQILQHHALYYCHYFVWCAHNTTSSPQHTSYQLSTKMGGESTKNSLRKLGSLCFENVSRSFPVHRVLSSSEAHSPCCLVEFFVCVTTLQSSMSAFSVRFFALVECCQNGFCVFWRLSLSFGKSKT